MIDTAEAADLIHALILVPTILLAIDRSATAAHPLLDLGEDTPLFVNHF